MPLPDELRARLDSPVADIVNLPTDRWALHAGRRHFLREFVPDGVQWVHMDIAGPAFLTAARGYNAQGGTGAVRTILTATRAAGAGAGQRSGAGVEVAHPCG